MTKILTSTIKIVQSTVILVKGEIFTRRLVSAGQDQTKMCRKSAQNWSET